MYDAPYAENTLLEVQHNEDRTSVLRFRFVEKDGDDLRCGEYSAWQTKDIQPKLRSPESNNTNRRSGLNEKFDKQKWRTGLDFNDRTREIWDLLHSYPLIGMKREKVSELLGPTSEPQDPIDGIDYYQLSSVGDVEPDGITYLELKYSNGLVSEFRTEEVKTERDLRVIAVRHPDQAALFYRLQGNFAEAESLYERALAMKEKALGPDNADVGVCLIDLAEVYRKQGKYAEAELLRRRALAIDEKALDPTRHDQLAVLYKAQRKYPDVEPLYKSTLQLFEERLGPNSPDVALALNNLATLYQAEGRYEEAEPLFKRSLEIWVKAMGPNYPHIATCLEDYAKLLRKTNREAEAIPLEARAKKIRAGQK
jgi:hypothetical protein